MRITGGLARGIPLKAPSGEATRPATDRMREAVFSSLGSSIEGCRVADLFAGTGSYGLEALSRGAHSASFFETERHALSCLKRNLEAVLRSAGLEASAGRIIPRDVYSLESGANQYELIFLDPPYESIEENLDRIFKLAVSPIAAENARVLLELPGGLEPALDHWELIRRIGKKGKNKPNVAVFRRKLEV